jgi:putative transposase
MVRRQDPVATRELVPWRWHRGHEVERFKNDLRRALTTGGAPHRDRFHVTVPQEKPQNADQVERLIGGWAGRLPISLSWRRNWARITPVFDYPLEIRTVIDTTNTIESINMSLRKVTKTHASFSSDEAVSKWFYFVLNNLSQNGQFRSDTAKAALHRFTIQFEGRLLPA